MDRWSPQHFKKSGLDNLVDPDILTNALKIAAQIKNAHPDLPPIFSLRHLAHLAGVDYNLLRMTVARAGGDPYTTFKLKKSDRKSYRIICAPENYLLNTQRWISKNILSLISPHESSVAYSKKCKIRSAASIHCECRWLIKLDITNFFESFSEIAVYRVFRSLGYQPLISFEMARICTRLGSLTRARSRNRWRSKDCRYNVIDAYNRSRIGHIPQGAPTSPMLTNLALRVFDKDLTQISNDFGLYYTRYADDMHFSTKDHIFNRKKCEDFISILYKRISSEGFSPNISKTRIYTPGARKIVLGLLVDGKIPKLTKEFRSNIRMHLHFLKHESVGPALHAQARGFDSVMGLRNHILGLINYAAQIQPELALEWMEEFNSIKWGPSI